ncbi:HTTM domain-containing protein [Fodinibius salsisoli]|uniref:HTTM domain-containing protein n=1 Tax=Fodinibius salsisoli TaxID=2820877 RepID=A0ABT3PQR1_9BACT|nr:HTTM domain-containing protein [Fodinibius salsisoli]MCW9708176.1 HTTM domain-containing protein [Fodinibius salsisoli]
MQKYISSHISIAPLVVFRVLFGFIMLVSTIRFAFRGWIYELYIKPDFFFTYYGFDWVQPLGEWGMYTLFFVIGLSALCMMLGYRYRLFSVLFFLCFTYVELIDKTNYLNHYYFVSIISFLLMLVPAHRNFSLDVVRNPSLRLQKVPAWTINIFKLQLGLVYFFAGLAKLNPDWMLHALPLKIWLPAQSHLPLIGWLFEYEWSAFLFSWAGAFYDLTIVFFLLYKPTRWLAYIAVIAFHLMTYFLFQIGMFPFIMILCTLIYFSAEFHQRLIDWAKKGWHFVARRSKQVSNEYSTFAYQPSRLTKKVLATVLVIHFILQVLIPFRFLLYPGHLFWTEQGYRFSWRVMLMEKAGHTIYEVYNPETDRRWEAANYDFLTPNQEKMMATQPDMILQFAHYLENYYQDKGIKDPEIRVKAHVTLNNHKNKLLVDPSVDLTKVKRGFTPKYWLNPFNDNQENWSTRN